MKHKFLEFATPQYDAPSRRARIQPLLVGSVVEGPNTTIEDDDPHNSGYKGPICWINLVGGDDGIAVEGTYDDVTTRIEEATTANLE